MEKSSDDCYFYYYSTCTKGDDCPYRHCQLALGSEVTCVHWQNGHCLRPNACKYRHMETRNNRSSTQCWFETQPMGCRKPHCVFLHQKPRNLTTDEEKVNTDGLILPVASSANNPSNCGDNSDNRDNSPNGANTSANPNPNSLKKSEDCSKIKLFDDSDFINQSLSAFNESSANIEPISISINDYDEESDDLDESERTDSSQQSATNDTISNKKYHKFKHLSGGNFGVKTLEQIRMEKVFNSTTDDSLIDDNMQGFDISKNETQFMTQKQLKNNQNNTDLRVKIKRQKFNNNSEAMSSASNLNRNTSESSSDSVRNFEIKTLDQIRKERKDMTTKSEMEPTGLKENLEPKGQNQELMDQNQEKKNPTPEPKGQKRSLSDSQPPVIKLRRSGPTPISSVKVQQTRNEPKEDCIDGKETISDHNVTTNEFETDQSNIISSTESNHKSRIASTDTDLDDFELFDGEPPNIDSNDAIDDDEDDELMREINQVINS